MYKLDETLHVFAARYAHHRATGGAFAVVSAIKKNWPDLTRATQLQLQREALEATQNKQDWQELIDL